MLQLTLTDTETLILSTISGEERVEIVLARNDAEGNFIKKDRILASGITTRHLRMIGCALVAFADYADAEAGAELSRGPYDGN